MYSLIIRMGEMSKGHICHSGRDFDNAIRLISDDKPATKFEGNTQIDAAPQRQKGTGHARHYRTLISLPYGMGFIDFVCVEGNEMKGMIYSTSRIIYHAQNSRGVCINVYRKAHARRMLPHIHYAWLISGLDDGALHYIKIIDFWW